MKRLFMVSGFFLCLVAAQEAEPRGASEVASVEFIEPEGYFIHDKVLHQRVLVKVTDDSGGALPYVPVNFSCSDTAIADFLFFTTITDSKGIAVNVIQCQVGLDTLFNPPDEFRERIPYLTAEAEGVQSSEVPVNILWGAIVEPQFMGPYFEGLFDSFVDTTVHSGEEFTWHGGLYFPFNPLDLPYDFDFSSHSTDSRIVIAESQWDGYHAVRLNMVYLSRGTATVVVNGFPPAMIEVWIDTEVKVEDQTLDAPTTPILQQNYPNPFNPETTIRFHVPDSRHVRLKVYDMLGREQVTLVDKRTNEGDHTVVFDAKKLASGVYFYQLQAGEFSQTRKLVLVR